jgi:hypothetical protein
MKMALSIENQTKNESAPDGYVHVQEAFPGYQRGRSDGYTPLRQSLPGFFDSYL